jgi:hypothetical protein
MNYSEHLYKRSQQRGININLIEFIIQNGIKKTRPGGVQEYLITKKQRFTIIDKLNNLINKINHSNSIGVLIDENDDTIITTYHKKRK